MTAVDVLAVMGRLCNLAFDNGGYTPPGDDVNEPAVELLNDAAEARAAVAELIEAAELVADNVILRETTEGRAIVAALARVTGGQS